MATPTLSNLLTFLRESGFLTPDQVQQVSAGNRPKFTDSQAVLHELVARGWLTAYQANQLGQGRGEDLILGPFRIVDRLGEGGMGQVLKAYHVNMGRVVAIKIIPRSQVANPTALTRFYREVRAVAQLSHPNIVTAFEVNQVGTTHYLAMEYVEGIDLHRLVQQSGPLPIPSACDYTRQAALGLQHAHEKGLVHRDIKPGNLMVTRPNPDEPPVVKVLDFGLARFESEGERKTRLTQLGHLVGTVDYIAPEQVTNPRTADIRADIYSLGCSLFYLLTGRPPFPGEDAAERLDARIHEDVPSVRQYRPDVPPTMDLILKKMTARDPAKRYQTPGEVAQALKGSSAREAESSAPAPDWALDPSATEDTSTPSQPGDQRRSRRRRRSPFQKALIGTVVLGVALVVLAGVVELMKKAGVNRSPDTVTTKREEPVVGEKSGKPLPEQVRNLPPILQRLARTQWVNTRNTTFEWTEDGKLLHAGIERPCDVDSDKQLRITFSGKHVDTLVFDAGLNQFEQFDSTVPNLRPLFRGRCVKRNAIPECPGEWVPLFNGKDLTGWATRPELSLQNWRVENGQLVSNAKGSVLFSERGDYGNFRFRIEARLAEKGIAGQGFRVQRRSSQGRYTNGYYVQANSNYVRYDYTGSLFWTWDNKDAGEAAVMVNAPTVQPGAWYTQEIIAIGPRIAILIDGKPVLDFIDPKPMFHTGHLTLHAGDPSGPEIRYRKVEVKEYPATPARRP